MAPAFCHPSGLLTLVWYSQNLHFKFNYEKARYTAMHCLWSVHSELIPFASVPLCHSFPVSDFLEESKDVEIGLRKFHEGSRINVMESLVFLGFQTPSYP